jgi:type IV pilus assembly protein PilF
LSARAFLQRYESVHSHGPDSLLLAYRIETALGDKNAAGGYRQALESGFSDSEQAAEIRKGPGK